jgi:hypothetical protein
MVVDVVGAVSAWVLVVPGRLATVNAGFSWSWGRTNNMHYECGCQNSKIHAFYRFDYFGGFWALIRWTKNNLLTNHIMLSESHTYFIPQTLLQGSTIH